MKERNWKIDEHIAIGETATSLVNGIRESAVGEGASLVASLQNEAGWPGGHQPRQRDRSGPKDTPGIDTTTLYGPLVRNEVNVSLAGPGSACRTERCVSLGRQRALATTTATSATTTPDCTSDELYKGIVAEGHGRLQRQGLR
ncbi:MAG: SufD family Fe-S cluster assembly protein [Flavobacteriales bacterium]|nr:SufD family Fe-S cluster assembly protein [Flavobacteriales bacterium]